MKHNRTNKVVNEGIAIVTEGVDPLHRKNFMCTDSLDKLLFKMSTDSGGKISQSQLIREALEKTYT